MTTALAAVARATPLTEAASTGADWTIQEIAQQPDVWEAALAILESRRSELEAWLEPLLADPRLRIVLTGAGTSAYAGEMLAPLLTRRLGRRVEAIATTDIVGSPMQHLLADTPTLMISYARSGSSPESVAAFDLAERLVDRCHHLVLCCNPESALVKASCAATDAQCVIMPAASLDRGFAMTSSFTSMVLVTVALFAPDDAQAQATVAAARALLAAPSDVISDLVGSGFVRVAFLGSGGLHGLATEAALKMLELSAGRTGCYAESALGFRHGPKFVVDDRTTVVLLTNSDPHTRRYDLDIYEELKRDGVAKHVIKLDDLDCLDGASLTEEWLGLVYIVWCQLLAYRNSVAVGNTPDNPCPSGEVNRVVQGVTIHAFDESAR